LNGVKESSTARIGMPLYKLGSPGSPEQVRPILQKGKFLP